MVEKDCVFCKPESFKETLVAEDKNFWITATLGQITDGGYLLVIPKTHYACIGEMTAEGAAKVAALNDFLRETLKKEYGCEVAGFEHGIGGQSIKHAHWHVIPAAVDFTAKIGRDFQTCETDALASLRDVPRSYGFTREPYLLWQTPDGQLRICYVHQGAEAVPKQYLRTLAAEALKQPERADWRAMDPELDERLIMETIARLRPYFNPQPTQSDGCAPKSKKC
jgi:diadenosine tetraphosphate (Ap4A) HIT family hydrolase